MTIHRVYGATYFFLAMFVLCLGGLVFVILLLYGDGIRDIQVFGGLSIGIPVLILAMYIKYLDLVPARVEVDGSSVRYYERDVLKTEVRFGEDVEVDATVNMALQTATHGALYGYRFIRGEDCVCISCDRGWRQSDIVAMWDLVVEAIREHRMRRGSAFDYVVNHYRQIDRLRLNG